MLSNNQKDALEKNIKIKERRTKTRHLIENGRLIQKAGLSTLPTNALYGGLLSLKEQMDENYEVMAAWIVKGDKELNKEQQRSKSVIITFESEPEKEVRDQLRSFGLKWSYLKLEWYGTLDNLDLLESLLANLPHRIDILDE